MFWGLIHFVCMIKVSIPGSSVQLIEGACFVSLKSLGVYGLGSSVKKLTLGLNLKLYCLI